MVYDGRQLVHEALKSVRYHSYKDNRRFLSALQDLSVEYPKDRRVYSKCLDDQFLGICSRAMEVDKDQTDAIISRASHYLQSNYLMAADGADRIAKEFVIAFARYGEKTEEPETTPESDQPEQDHFDEPTVILTESSRKKITKEQEEFSPDDKTNTQKEESPTSDGDDSETDPSKKNQKKKVKAIVLIIVAFGLVCAILIALFGETQPEAELAVDEATIAVDSNYTIKVAPYDYEKLELEISDNSILYIVEDDEDLQDQFTVQGLEEGDASITAYADGYEIGTCNIKVVDPVISFESSEKQIVSREGDTDFSDNTAIVLASTGSKDTVFIDEVEISNLEWTSSNEKVLKLLEHSGNKVPCEVMDSGFTTITAKQNEEVIVSKEMVVAEKNSKEILVEQKELTVEDSASVAVYCDYDVNNPEVHLVANYDSWMDVTWDDNYDKGLGSLTINKKSAGTGTIDVFLADKNQSKVEGSEPVTIKVTFK